MHDEWPPMEKPPLRSGAMAESAEGGEGWEQGEGEGSGRDSLAWCHVCEHTVRVRESEGHEPACLECGGTFVEYLEDQEQGEREEQEGRGVGWASLGMSNALPFLMGSSQSGEANDVAAFFSAILQNMPNNLHSAVQVYNNEGRPIANLGDFAWGNDLERIIAQLGEQNPGSNPRTPTSQAEIDRLPSLTIGTDSLKGADLNECPVCCEEFKQTQGAVCRRLPCDHIFHEGCILPWLREHNSCPYCRHRLEAEPESPDE